MTTQAAYYPEFDSTEVAQTIAPLAAYDHEIAGLLRAPVHRIPGPRRDGRRTAVEAWLGAPESYPFQRIVRSVAASVADANPFAAYGARFGDPEVLLPQLLDHVEARLREIYTRPLVAAVNHAREAGLLAGDSPAERYTDFTDRSAAASFEEVSGLDFPVLRELARIVREHATAAARELAGRLAADRDAIEAAFGIDAADPVVHCAFSEGDAHHRGRGVTLLRFASGHQLVYKPRDVSCEAAYAALAAELNDWLGTSLAATAVLDCGGYGYTAFVAAEDVSATAADFMHASGELAAVFYLLNARDMHFENLVPTRRGPVPVDLETILHPARIHRGPVPEAADGAYEAMGQSVYGIGILPLVMQGKGAGAGHVDLGFLGGSGQGSSPFKSLRFAAPFTDRIRLLLEPPQAQPRQTVVPALTEEETLALGERMAAGFARVYRAVLAEPDRWTALLEAAVAGVRVRYVHNPTALYAQTLRMAASAGALADAPTYLALLKRIGIASKTSSHRIAGSEMRQLAVRDVPYFTVPADGVALHDGDGAEVGASFDVSPLERAQAKAAGLSEAGLGQQLGLIRSAFASRFPDNHLPPAAPASSVKQRTTGGSLTDLLRRLCDGLVATSLPDRFAHLPRTWIGPLASAQADRPWPPGVLGYDLYTGRVGPALALAAAGRVLDEPAYRDLAGQVFTATAEILADERYELRSVRAAGFAAYTGLSGTLYALAAAGRLLGRADWERAAQGALPLVIDQVRELPADELPMDVIGGAAGVLPCSAAIGGPHADAAIALLTSRITDAWAAGQLGPVLGQSGFAHGISGLVHALGRAYPRLPRDRKDTAAAVLADLIGRLEDFYDPAEADWRSNLEGPASFATGWCHGATGIALALAAHARLDPSVLPLRDGAVANILRRGLGRNLTWCHGDLGSHDTLTTVAAKAEPALRDELRAQLAAVERDRLPADVLAAKITDPRSRYAHTNSLMVGSAGLALHLVNRIGDGVRVSPLTFHTEAD
ncbi:type 2 lanthipeptide synthetase LanM family protein [Streptomyces boninensis]|uniref:type 2 lanthipeptide synthetase LanM family protein n=1 Tax=Streptomyces boninensis TaxID=2039455 RepID=UPI003B226004